MLASVAFAAVVCYGAAVDRYVAPTGSDIVGTNDCLTQSLPCLTIQHAVDVAVAGNVVNVAAGTYNEQVVIDNKDLTLQGAGDTTVLRPSAAAVSISTYTYPAGTFWPGTVMANIIQVTNSGAVTVKDLKVDGSLVTTTPAGASRVAGILYGGSGGVIDNVTVDRHGRRRLQHAPLGIDLSAVGTARTVEDQELGHQRLVAPPQQHPGPGRQPDRRHPRQHADRSGRHAQRECGAQRASCSSRASLATPPATPSVASSTGLTSSRRAGILFYDPARRGHRGREQQHLRRR